MSEFNKILMNILIWSVDNKLGKIIERNHYKSQFRYEIWFLLHMSCFPVKDRCLQRPTYIVNFSQDVNAVGTGKNFHPKILKGYLKQSDKFSFCKEQLPGTALPMIC